MRIHPPKLAIDESAPFKDALFDRETFATSLTSLLRNVSDNLVVLVHAPWGAGKTTFARMWQAELRRQKLNVLYFDAYESDYFSDPFVCFSGEILKLAEKRFTEGKGLSARREFKKNALKVGKRLAGLATKVVLKSATLGAIDETHLKELNEIGSELASGVGDISAGVIEEQIQHYSEQKESWAAFKKSLTELAAVVREEQGFPLTIIVDELDRCRPDFALALLERIKHLFDVDGVAFVILVNRDQLENYIRGVYGNVDARAYLLKFANLFVDLPTGDPNAPGSKGLYHYCDLLWMHFELENRAQQMGHVLSCLKTLANHFQPTLRELENVFSVMTVYYASRKKNEYMRHILVAVLALLKVIQPRLYTRLSISQVTCAEFFKETRIDEIQNWSGAIGDEEARLLLQACLMSHAEFTKATTEEKAQRGTTKLHDAFESLYMKPKQVIPLLCSHLDRFALKL